MTDARWSRIKAVFEAALDRPPSERAAFLAAATGGDEALRREVESLLDSDGAEIGFTDRLPVQHRPPLADSLASDPLSGEPTRSGTDARDMHFGPYRILTLLGVGGMGEVFRAQDTKLNRDVALKRLPRAFEFDPDRLARFRREAHALAALNHPHIAAIYGLEEWEGRQALVLELVEGVTLESRIAQGPLPLGEALSYARQIAEALQAAHDKGIVHRDLKPANIKVTSAGVLKVLDFGLAKTVAGESQTTHAAEVPSVADGTRVGLVLGTAAYMSPEQARGEEVDARTDVWAFGCVLFEMLAGRKAFAADAASDSIAKILEQDPDWGALPKSTPARIHQLLRHCLQKDRRRRLQTIAAAHATVEQLLARRPLVPWHWAAIGTAAALAVSAGLYFWLRSDRQPVVAGRSEWTQLTNLDSIIQPALSPDGRMLAFIRGFNTFVSPGQLYVKQLPDGEPVALTNDDMPKMGPVFSPDGSRIAYTVNEGSTWDTWEVPTLRGSARRWLRNASGLTWAGTRDLLFSEIKTGRHMAIVRADESRGDAHDLYVPAHTSAMAHRSQLSPDGKWVLVVEMDEGGVWLPCRLHGIDGAVSQAAGPAPARCTNAAWTPDGRWMYFTADAGDGFHVWRQRFPDGRPEQLTFGPTEEEGLAMAPDGKSLVTSVGLVQRGVWLHTASGERQISLEGYAFLPLLSADDQKLCFRLTRSPATGQSPSELWLADLGSGALRRLFPGQLVTGFDLSHDDRVAAAVVESDGRSGVWLAWLDDREPPRRVPNADGDNPRFFPTGEVLFRAIEGNTAALYRIQENGERRERITNVVSTVFGNVSPDGEWLSSNSTNTSSNTMLSLSGQASRPLLPNSQTSRLRWNLDGTHRYVSFQYGQASAFGAGRTYVLPVASGSVLAGLPPGGFKTEDEIASVPGVVAIPHGDVALGSSPAVYAFARVTTTRNLYRIPLP